MYVDEEDTTFAILFNQSTLTEDVAILFGATIK